MTDDPAIPGRETAMPAPAAGFTAVAAVGSTPAAEASLGDESKNSHCPLLYQESITLELPREVVLRGKELSVATIQSRNIGTVCRPGGQQQSPSVHFLEAVTKHGSIDFGQEIVVHMNLVVGRDP